MCGGDGIASPSLVEDPACRRAALKRLGDTWHSSEEGGGGRRGNGYVRGDVM